MNRRTAPETILAFLWILEFNIHIFPAKQFIILKLPNICSQSHLNQPHQKKNKKRKKNQLSPPNSLRFTQEEACSGLGFCSWQVRKVLFMIFFTREGCPCFANLFAHVLNKDARLQPSEKTPKKHGWQKSQIMATPLAKQIVEVSDWRDDRAQLNEKN